MTTGTPTPGLNLGGTGDPVTPPTVPASEPGTDAWYSTAFTDEGNREYVKSKGFKTNDAFATSYRELEKEMSSRPHIELPKAIDDYVFDAPADADKFGYNPDVSKAFKDKCFELKVPAKAAAELHNWYAEMARQGAGASETAKAAARDASIDTAFKDLSKDWGAPEGKDFQRNVELAKRAIRMLDPGLKDAMVKSGAIVLDGKGGEYVADAQMFKVMSIVGKNMFAEDSVHGTAADVAGDVNPFAPGSENVMLQGRLVREDPERALALIKSSGREAEYAFFISKMANDRSKAKR